MLWYNYYRTCFALEKSVAKLNRRPTQRKINRRKESKGKNEQLQNGIIRKYRSKNVLILKALYDFV